MDDDYEYVGLVAGTAGDEAWPAHVSACGLQSMGALLREVHDATIGWVPPSDACWSVPYRAGSVICHGDPKPGNFAWLAGRAAGLFDWDAARPGDPSDDVAYALWWVVPVNLEATLDPGNESSSVAARRARAEAFLEGYGWEGPLDVVDVAVARHEQAIDEVLWLGKHGHEPHVTWVMEGWPGRWRHQVDSIRTSARQAFPSG